MESAGGGGVGKGVQKGQSREMVVRLLLFSSPLL